MASRKPSSRAPTLSELADTDLLDVYAGRMPPPVSERERDRGAPKETVRRGPDMEPHRRAVAKDLRYYDGASPWVGGANTFI